MVRFLTDNPLGRTWVEIMQRRARPGKAYAKGEGYVQGDLFMDVSRSEIMQLTFGFDVSDVESAEIWERIEAELVGLLASFAEKTVSGPAYQRKLFAEGAAADFALLDTLGRRCCG